MRPDVPSALCTAIVWRGCGLKDGVDALLQLATYSEFKRL